MEVRVVAFTKNALELAKKLIEVQGEKESLFTVYTVSKWRDAYPMFQVMKEGLEKWTEEAFKSGSGLLFISATGIAVRAIAPFIKDKYTDPAVLVMDEKGKYVIALLSGHVGGANELAEIVADYLGATPIISTATNLNGLFAVDEWAYKNKLRLIDKGAAKEFAARLLKGESLQVETEFPVNMPLPKQLVIGEVTPYGLWITTSKMVKRNRLKVVPPIFTIGIGCRKGISKEKIEQVVLSVLDAEDIAVEAVEKLASIDLKKEEAGLVAFGEKYHLPIQFFTSQELGQLSGDFTPSSFVKQITNVDNVCERAAVAASGGVLVVRKLALDGITVAIAKKEYTVNFKETANRWSVER